MASGKSSIGRLLAKKLDWSFYDTDEMVEKQVGSSVASIIQSQGEQAFRLVEKQAVRLVALMDRAVVATGGGVPLDESNMDELSKNGLLIWLKVTPETILNRIKNLSSRPLIDPADPLASIQSRLDERLSAYGKARFSIDTDGLNKEQVVEKIRVVAEPYLV